MTDNVARGLALSAIRIAPNHSFTDDAQRDAYFVAHPTELVESMFIFNGDKLQQYNGTSWLDATTAIKGDKGDVGEQGIQGDTGNGIVSITKIGTVGLVDTYRITYSDATFVDYTVTNGADDVLSVNGKTGIIVLTTADIADSNNKRYVTEAQLAVLLNTSGTNSGDETVTSIGTLVNGATAKTTPIDADMLPLMDSEDTNKIKKFSWANLKLFLNNYFDTLTSGLDIPLKAFTKKNDVNFVGNLNDLTAGITWCASNATNLPIANSGYCTTVFGISGCRSQTFVTYTTKIVYVRVLADSVWGAWAKLPYIEDAYTKKNIATFSGGNVRTLTPGITWCDNTCTNLPVTDDWGLMTVTAGDLTQTILSLEFRGITKNTIYVCTYVNSLWSPWTKVASPREVGVPTAGTNCTLSAYLLERTGSFCHASMDILLNANVATSAIIATMPVGYRASGTFYVPCRVLNNGTYQSTYVQVQNGGNVIIGDAMTANSHIIFDTSYILTSY